jgi:hypothetical protein
MWTLAKKQARPANRLATRVDGSHPRRIREQTVAAPVARSAHALSS